MASFNVELNNKEINFQDRQKDPKGSIKKGSGEYNLFLRITINRKHARIKLNYAVQKKHFNPNPSEYKYIRGSHPKHAVINQHIDNKIQEAKDVITKLENKKQLVTANSVKAEMIKPAAATFLEFANNLATSIKENNQVATYKKYNTVIQKLTDFRKDEDFYLEEMTPAFLASFESSLKKLGNSINTINSNFRTIRAIYYNAIEKGLVDQSKNPFFTYKLKLNNSVKERLNEEEIQQIENLNLSGDVLIDSIRDAFLFSYYNAGIRISDILKLTWDNVKDGKLTYKMHKTNRVHSFKLKEKPILILEKYKGKDEVFVFPFFSSKYDYSDPVFLHSQIGSKTAIFNKYLKYIASRAGITKKMTTHIARHSFADIARQKTDNIYNLSKTLGHSSLKVTEAYLSSFDEKAVDDTLDSMFN
jgi:site-specific recombinase XerD